MERRRPSSWFLKNIEPKIDDIENSYKYLKGRINNIGNNRLKILTELKNDDDAVHDQRSNETIQYYSLENLWNEADVEESDAAHFFWPQEDSENEKPA